LQHQHHSQDFWLRKKPVLTKCSQYPTADGKQHQSTVPIDEHCLTPEAPYQDQGAGQKVCSECDQETAAEKPVDQKAHPRASSSRLQVFVPEVMLNFLSMLHQCLDLELVVQAVVPDPVGEENWMRWFGHWLAQMECQESVELVLRLTNDQELCALNTQFRSIASATDVLAFPAEPVNLPLKDKDLGYLGDIAISVPWATRRSEEFGHALESELAWLGAHGLLHLLGWDHPDEVSWQQMVSKQCQLLEGVNLTYDWSRVYSNIL
jgi:probable rRNA maturation factor